ncbi:cellulose 1,4-beta-cellobiosidase [Streptomyces lincolnensis]|uniref:Glucanase n=1 Tax=Streptomyces lincolnensis TaxID=1915 RepID=A0A1B1MK35_STRLN|nr:glycoside hydrolase family 6 protein [Streptomyces lincolnensis]ANS68959.1 cellulose 1,4-beta-cellobiosidase [Streptomyces lincolnensis]AXG57878.1 cellulose 1,4-beta-cellobiosidase [Streptomyces lincolnensis]QMV10549.1 cellobiohydrolase [Streptomyces lincolnensis]
MTNPTRADGASLPRTRRRRSAALATALATLMLGAAGQIAGQPAAAAEAHVDNPFAGASFYLNPDYAEHVDTSIAQTSDATLKAKMEKVKSYPTAVWLDRIAAIHGGAANAGRKSLADHLDLALAQKKPGQPITATFVVYDLPGRDCAALASSGELPLTQAGLARYKSEYIDVIANVFKNPKYQDIRITTVVEPDSLPNLVTNTSDPECAQAKSSGVYVEGIRYALDKLHAVPNVYTYLDYAHSGWLGWDNNLTQTVQQYTDVARGTAAGLSSVDGLITNVANYTPLEEPFLTDPNKTVGGTMVKSSKYYEWNPNFDESDFTKNVHRTLVSAGWPASTGMVVDTSRNGWGGSARPTAESTSTSLETYVTESKADRRTHRGLWCNASGAGLGQPPQTAPSGHPDSHLDAFLWVKPPGESDGASKDIPNEEGKRADPMCDPDYTAPNAGNNKTGALPDAPLAGHWFHNQFSMLVRNAYPAVPTGGTGPGDTTAPTAPTGLRATAKTASSVSLAWTAATDDVGVSGYDVYRDGTKVSAQPVGGTTFTDTGLSAATAYSYTVRARDAAGNVSAASAALSATTETGGGGPDPTGGLKVAYRNHDASATDNAIRPGLRITNTGSAALDLTGVVARYYFTRDGGSPTVNAWCDYAAVGCSNVKLRVVPLSTPVAGADAYLEVGFSAGSLAAGRDTGDIQLRMAKTDWSAFDETDDHSRTTATSYTEAPAIPAYLGTVRAWGMPPA